MGHDMSHLGYPISDVRDGTIMSSGTSAPSYTLTAEITKNN